MTCLFFVGKSTFCNTELEKFGGWGNSGELFLVIKSLALELFTHKACLVDLCCSVLVEGSVSCAS